METSTEGRRKTRLRSWCGVGAGQIEQLEASLITPDFQRARSKLDVVLLKHPSWRMTALAACIIIVLSFVG